MSRAAGEVVTLQLGNYANYVGTHWWNLQESTFTYDRAAAGSREIDHDVLYREGATLGGEVTYTPRLIAFDLECNVGSLRKQGTLYDAGDAAFVAWPEDLVSRYVRSAASDNEFLRDLRRDDALAAATAAGGLPAAASYRERPYDLDDAVRQWSDYLRVHLHPKTIGTIGEYDVQAECEPFNVYGYGEQLYDKHKYVAEVEDKLHFFAEECDYLQGFQLLCDTSDGFGGFASRAAALLAEEFPRRRAMCYCTIPASFSRASGDDALHRLVNNALSWSALCDGGACVVPLSLSDDPWLRCEAAVRLPHVRYRPELPYHTSAVIASALDTATLPYRIRDGGSGQLTLGGLHGTLTEGGRRVCNVAVSLPFAMRPGGGDAAFAAALESCCAAGGAGLGATSLLPKYRGSSAALVPFVQSAVVRGVAGLNRHKLAADVERHLRAAGCGPLVCGFACVEQPCVLEPPYPRFFDESVLPDGSVMSAERFDGRGGSRERPGWAAAATPPPLAYQRLLQLSSPTERASERRVARANAPVGDRR